MKSFAIVIVCYNRLPGVVRLLKSLESADYNNREDIHLVFSIDYSGDSSIEEFAQKFFWPHGEKTIRVFNERQGLKKHILQCGDLTENYDIVTVLEDDIFVSDSFYQYAYQASEFYWDEDNVAGISLYSFQKNWLNWLYRFEPQRSGYDTYFLKVAQSWGQVWTKNKWLPFKKWIMENPDFLESEKIPKVLNLWPDSSWLKYHDRYCIEQNKFFVYPYVSLSTNYSDPGEHAEYAIADHQVELQYNKKSYEFPVFNDNAVKYDEYMERIGLGKYVGVQEEDLTVSLWGTKQKNLYKRFLLSCKDLPYKVVAEYSINLRPLELSIILNHRGSGIYLYDTNQADSSRKKDNTYLLILYSVRSHDALKLLPFSIKLFFTEYCKKIKLKMWRLLNRFKR